MGLCAAAGLPGSTKGGGEGIRGGLAGVQDERGEMFIPYTVRYVLYTPRCLVIFRGGPGCRTDFIFIRF